MTAPKGLDVPFRFTSTRGSPAWVDDVDCLDRSIRTILRTVPGERVYRPAFGSWVSLALFANMGKGVVDQVRTEIREAILTHERRVDVTDILFEFEENTVWVTVYWQPNGRQLDYTTRLGFPV